MNWNSGDLRFSSTSRSAFRHTTPLSTHGFQLHAVPSSFHSHRRPDGVASLLKDAPVPMLTKGDGQTEDGHAMIKFDTFHSFQNLSHAVRESNETVNKCAQTSRLTCT